MSKIIGLDLGTSNSCVAIMEGGEGIIIPNAEGSRITSSAVGFSKKGERLVGQAAKRQAVVNPDETVLSIKRKMGSNFKAKLQGKEYTPPEISAMILQKLKGDAEEYLGETIDKAVITVPAYFSDSQRQATKDAGRIAGLDVVRIINEPTAAALAYGADKKQDQKILVFDLGGGTFDVSILEIGEGVFEVIATSGNNHLGGDDFDQRIVGYLCDEFLKQTGIDLRKDKRALQRLGEAAEKAKIELSGLTITNINLPFITQSEDGPQHLDIDLTRAQFEQLIDDLVQKTMGPTRQALEDSGLSATEIDEILLVGGSTRVPAVQKAIKDLLGKEPNKSVNPDECVAIGAAIQAGIIAGDVDDIVLVDVTPLSLGIETLGGVFTKLIERNTAIPTSKGNVFTTAADSQTSVDIHVLQGERAMAADNKTLGRFQLTEIPPAPRGIPQIEVTFDIDVNGIVNVSAVDKGTGRKKNITIKSSSGLSEEEIEKMVNTAKEHEEEDKRKKERVELRNEADSLIFQVDKTLKEAGDKIDPQLKEKVAEKKKGLQDALEKDDDELINSSKEALTEVLHEYTSQLYAQMQQEEQQASEGGQEPTASDENIYDAEYKEVEDDEDSGV